jgi:hypothetical protein
MPHVEQNFLSARSLKPKRETIGTVSEDERDRRLILTEVVRAGSSSIHLTQSKAAACLRVPHLHGADSADGNLPNRIPNK